jgi:phosphoribosyl 1,2-cyclic phosphodiesterase
MFLRWIAAPALALLSFALFGRFVRTRLYRRLRSRRRLPRRRIRMEQLTRVFITHLHSDHTAGYPDPIFTPAVTRRREPFEAHVHPA